MRFLKNFHICKSAKGIKSGPLSKPGEEERPQTHGAFAEKINKSSPGLLGTDAPQLLVQKLLVMSGHFRILLLAKEMTHCRQHEPGVRGSLKKGLRRPRSEPCGERTLSRIVQLGPSRSGQEDRIPAREH